MQTDQNNVYEREKLYDEVWNSPVTKVAKTYGISDVAIRKICRSMKIPTPPNGYWAKLKYGKPVHKTPLPPDYDGPTTKTGIDPTAPKNACIKIESDPLDFLSPSEKEKYQQISSSIEIESDTSLNKELLSYQKQYNQKILNRTVSEKQLPRFYNILNCLIENIKKLGYTVNKDMTFCIRGEIVSFSLVECQTKNKHDMTPEEKEEFQKHKKAIEKNEWARKPYIPTYDYNFNGNLSFNTLKHSCIRDTEKSRLESRIPDMLSQLIQRSEILHMERLEREEAQRRREEEERQRELLKKAYNNEVDKLSLLIKEANDFEIATKIRDYVYYVQQKDFKHKKAAWIKWAKEKADWYDPTINKPDSIFGKREHGTDTVPTKKGNRYFW